MSSGMMETPGNIVLGIIQGSFISAATIFAPMTSSLPYSVSRDRSHVVNPNGEFRSEQL
jgi:hypothetical protein